MALDPGEGYGWTSRKHAFKILIHLIQLKWIAMGFPSRIAVFLVVERIDIVGHTRDVVK